MSGGMSVAQASVIRGVILLLCVGSLVMIFQPFSLTLFSIGAALIVFAGLAFNLMPIAQPGRPFKAVIRAGIVVLIVFVVALAIAIISTELYKVYLKSV